MIDQMPELSQLDHRMTKARVEMVQIEKQRLLLMRAELEFLRAKVSALEAGKEKADGDL